MAIQVAWDNAEKTLIHIQFERDWTWDEIYGIYGRITDLLQDMDYKVAVIINLANVFDVRKGLNMRKVQDHVQQNHPLTDFVVIYNASPVVVPIVNTLLRASSTYQLTVARSEAEARERVAAHRASLS